MHGRVRGYRRGEGRSYRRRPRRAGHRDHRRARHRCGQRIPGGLPPYQLADRHPRRRVRGGRPEYRIQRVLHDLAGHPRSHLRDRVDRVVRVRVRRVVTVLVALIVYLVLARTPLGRQMYAIGSNERVARLAGVRTAPIRLGAFMAAGAIASVAGVLQLAVAGAALPSFGSNLLLPAFAGVFLGSTFVDPGRFNVVGTVMATLVLAVGFSGLSLLGADFWVQPVFSGVVLIGAVLISQVRRGGTPAIR
ncbi:ABC transporter permease [Microbacterium aquimaris]|uniref:ABC transporter permease n=1 Tax=Microbacterium aquimaris TaxID=459816 RepID=UPI002AD39B37|nr:ABC transporter permease [Microbacterium aquimaris]MDZ8274831.1 ABC transporter permease [Microbacterium aquimaris]